MCELCASWSLFKKLVLPEARHAAAMFCKYGTAISQYAVCGSAGVYYISDKQDNYCATFDAHLKVTAT